MIGADDGWSAGLRAVYPPSYIFPLWASIKGCQYYPPIHDSEVIRGFGCRAYFLGTTAWCPYKASQMGRFGPQREDISAVDGGFRGFYIIDD